MKRGDVRYLGDGIYVKYTGQQLIVRVNEPVFNSIHLDEHGQIELRNILEEILPNKREEDFAMMMLACLNYTVANLEHIRSHPFHAGFPRSISLERLAELGCFLEEKIAEKHNA